MALPAFDPVKHHVGLGDSAGTELGFIVSGAYSKAFKRDMTDELSSIHYGGAASLDNRPGVSTWTMDDFTGGAFQQVWGRDPKMFSSCSGMLPSQFDRSLRTVPPFKRRAVAGAADPYQHSPLVQFAMSGQLVSFFSDRYFKYDLATGATDEVVIGTDIIDGELYGGPYLAACFDRRHKLIIASTNGNTIVHINPITNVIVKTYASPLESHGDVTGLSSDGSKLALAIGNAVWVLSQPDTSPTLPDDEDWARIGALPGKWVDSVYLNGLLYILCADSDTRTQVVAFDGVSILPITDLPFNFVGECLESYAGRLYIGGAGRDISDAASYAELYEITGSSLRLIRTFAPEKRSDRYSSPTTIRSMCVHEGLLFLADDNISGLTTDMAVYAYDVTTDALYGAHRFWADSGHPLGLISARERLWLWGANGSGTGLFSGIVEADGVNISTGSISVIETSDFAADFDRLKRWKLVRVMTRGDWAYPTVDVSIDGGDSWLSPPTLASEQSGQFRVLTLDLSGIPASRQLRCQISFLQLGVPQGFAELVGFTASFKLIDSEVLDPDAREKLGWQFTIAGVETVELGDGEADVQRLAELRAQLWTWSRDRRTISFKDTDGQRYDVEVDTLREHQPAILPPVAFDDPLALDGAEGREAFYTLTLVEK